MADTTVPFTHPTAAQHAAERDRSYKVRLRGGERIRADRDVLACWSNSDWSEVKHIVIPAGTVLTQVGSDTNAGFRGIEMFAWHEVDGVRYHANCSTGAFTVVG
jgi:hypothetical protein